MTEDCETVTNITLPNGEYEFKNYKDIENIILPETLKNIYKYMFWKCFNLKSIDGCLFMNCICLGNILLSNTIESINNYAFMNCTSLNIIKIPIGVKLIGDCAFMNCTSLKDVLLPDSIEYIGKFAFKNCTLLKSIAFPKNIKFVDPLAFVGTLIYYEEPI